MQLKNPFQTSFGTLQTKDFFITELIDEQGNHGFGESVAFPSPWYTEETVETTQHMLERFLIPILFQAPIEHPDQVSHRFSIIRRNHMAKAAIEGAVWDLYAKRQALPLATVLGGTRETVEVGVSIGIQPTISELLDKIDGFVSEGYKRVKLKVKPGWDIDVVRAVRVAFPTLPIMVDANGAYSLKDIDHLKQFDAYNLLMIEQPFGENDFIDHAKLQAELETPICLDESIHSLNDVQLADHLGSCTVISIKIGRVGGLSEAKKIHDFCAEHHIPVWCGGMLEAGVGRAHSIALSTLSEFQFPGDTSASNRYWEKDIIQPEVTMQDGLITIPQSAGIGYAIDWESLETYRVDHRKYSNEN